MVTVFCYILLASLATHLLGRLLARTDAGQDAAMVIVGAALGFAIYMFCIAVYLHGGVDGLIETGGFAAKLTQVAVGLLYFASYLFLAVCIACEEYQIAASQRHSTKPKAAPPLP